MTDNCPIRHELRREYDIMWRRIDEHGTHIVDMKSVLSELKANTESSNLRYERLLVSLAESKGEDREKWAAMSGKIDRLCEAEARRQQTDADKARYWKWGLSVAAVVIAAMALAGRGEAALPPPQSCLKCNPIPIFVEESM